MKIGYKKRHLNINLILGIIWLVWFFVFDFNKKEMNWTDYGWLVISIAYLSIYFYQRQNKYLTLENGIIKQNWPFGKKIKLKEITGIKHFAGEYILKSELKKMKINIGLIESESLSELKTELKKLNVKWV